MFEELKALQAKKHKLVEILRRVRTPIFRASVDSTFPLLYFEEAYLDSGPYFMPFVILPTLPCSWLIRGGGCFECGYSNLANANADDEQVLDLLNRHLELLRDVPHQMVAVGTSGSFLDTRELSRDAQNQILSKVRTLPYLEVIGIESRPEFITSERIREISEIAFPKRIVLGMGLESSSDLIRDFCINKGLTTAAFLRAKDIAQQYHNISVLAYVLIGKPFLPRAIDIDDAISSIKFAVNAGFDRVILMATSLRENTLTKLLYESGEYSPPGHRTIIEVLKQLEPEVQGKVVVANPRLPAAISPDPCPVCSKLLEQLLLMYKLTSNPAYLTLPDKVQFNCHCAKDSEDESRRSRGMHLEEIILDSYEKVLPKLGASNDA